MVAKIMVPTKNILILIQLTLIYFVSGSKSLETFKPESDTKTVPRCGDSYNVPTGSVFYKPFEQVLEHERCVWTVHVPEALGYAINVKFLGSATNLPSTGQGLVLTGITWQNAEAPIITNYIPTSIGTFNITDVNTIVVTFFTSEQTEEVQSTGIVLDYETLFVGNATVVNATSRHVVVDSRSFDFAHPAVGPYYSPTELSTFVFPPSNNFHIGCGVTINWQIVRMEGVTCNDALYIYKFNSSGPSQQNIFWDDGGRICGDAVSEVITHDDIVMILFTTTPTLSYDGFYFDFVAC